MGHRRAHLAKREAELAALAQQTGGGRDDTGALRPETGIGRAGRDFRAEDVVGEVLRQAQAAQERKVCQVQIARPPAEQRGVESKDQRLTAAILGPPDQRTHELVVARPVELEPAWRIPHRGSAVFHRDGGLVGKNVSDSFGPCGPRDGKVGLAVRHLQHADRREQQRRLVPAPEKLDGKVAARHVAQHARHETMALEGHAVGRSRSLRAGAPNDVGSSLAAHRGSGLRFEFGRRDRHLRPPAARPGHIDLGLTQPSGAGFRRNVARHCSPLAGPPTCAVRRRSGSPPCRRGYACAGSPASRRWTCAPAQPSRWRC